MFRTRDFVLLFTCIVFLLVAIGSTSVFQLSQSHRVASPLAPAPEQDLQFSAVVTEQEDDARATRLANLKRKIAASQLVTISEPDSVNEPVPEPEDTPTTSEATTNAEAVLCAYHQPTVRSWPATEVSFEVAEGMRLVIEKIDTEPVSTTSSSTAEAQKVLLQLPVVPTLSAHAHCIASDVVGIALDGSLIRNDEAVIYRLFGEATLIGYALDGVPIYGNGSAQTDTCGGHTANGQYRYQLSDTRDTIVNCFSATPVAF